MKNDFGYKAGEVTKAFAFQGRTYIVCIKLEKK